MAGHTSELRWLEISDLVGRKLTTLSNSIIEGEKIYQELLELWQFHGNVDQSVANQLFAPPTDTSGTYVASATEVAMATDLKAAMVEAHNLYTTLDWPTFRRMTGGMVLT